MDKLNIVFEKDLKEDAYNRVAQILINQGCCDRCGKVKSVLESYSDDDEYYHASLCKECIFELFEKYEKEKAILNRYIYMTAPQSME